MPAACASTDALCVAADAWGSYLDPECPLRGWPLADSAIEPTGVGAICPIAGRATRLPGAELPVVDLAEKERVGGALRALDAAVRAAVRSGGGATRRGRRQSVRARIGRRSDRRRDRGSTRRRSPRCARSTTCRRSSRRRSRGMPRRSRRYDAAALIVVPRRPALRDIALVRVVRRPRRGRRGARRAAALGGGRGVSGAPRDAHVGRGRAAGAATGWSTALALVAPARGGGAARRRAPARSRRARGWRGRSGGRPTRSATRALACEIEPEHGLAEIVRSFVHAGHLPDWAFRRAG